MSVFLAQLTISHFRSHRRARLEFDGRPVVLAGHNGSGKTNIIEAVSLLSPGRGLRRAAPDEIMRKPETLGWKLRAEIFTPNATRRIETWAEPGQTRQLRIDDKAAPQIALGTIMAMLWLTPMMDRLWLEAAEGRRRFLDRMVLSFRPDHAAEVLAYEKAMRERNRLLRDGVGDGGWYGALEVQMAGAGTRISANRREALALLAQYADTDSPFPVAELVLECSAPTEEAALLTALSENRNRDMAAGRSLTGPHRADLRARWAAKDMDAAQCSTGEQKALLISLILANARALTDIQGSAPILLLDEIAAHLDKGRRAALYDALCGLDAQAFLTGTGPELFEELGPRAQHFLLRDDGGQSQIESLAP